MSDIIICLGVIFFIGGMLGAVYYDETEILNRISIGTFILGIIFMISGALIW